MEIKKTYKKCKSLSVTPIPQIQNRGVVVMARAHCALQRAITPRHGFWGNISAPDETPTDKN